MTINDLIRAAAQHSGVVFALFVAPPMLTWCNGRLHGTRLAGASAPFSYIYSGLIYSG